MTITELSIKRPTIVFVIFAVLIGLGIYSYTQTNYELLPKMNVPVVTITTIYPGAAPSEVESSVTKIIEDAVSGVDKIDRVSASSREGVSIVVIEFVSSANTDFAAQDVQRMVNQVLSKLPDDAKTPVISKISLDDLPVIRMGVSGNMPSKDFYQFVTDHIQPRISKLSGVGRIVLIGGDEREIKVNVDMQKLKGYGLSLLQVNSALNNSSMEIPGGNIKSDESQFSVKLAGKVSSIDELRNIVIATSKDGGKIQFSDIAEIQDGIKEYTNIGRINGKTAISVNVYKQNDANTVDVVRLAKKEMAAIEQDYAQMNVKFEISSDASVFTLDSVKAVLTDLGYAILLVAIVMLVFLHSIRNSLIVMVAIPTSLISTFIGMYIFGMSLNLMTLLAMSLVIGILVDDSIVVLENIHRHLLMGKTKRKAALEGRNEIGFAALSITMVDVVVFLPVSLVGGTIGSVVRNFSLVVVFSTLLSLFVSFTITPLLASRFSKHEKFAKGTIMGKFGEIFESLFNKTSSLYSKILNWSLNNGWKIIMIVVVLFFAGLSLLPLGFIGSEMFPQTDSGEFAVQLEMPLRTPLKQTNYITQQVEKIISEIPEVETLFANAGASSEGMIGQSSNYTSEITVRLVPFKERKRGSEAIGQEIRNKVNIPGVIVRTAMVGMFGMANQAPVSMVVQGTDPDSVLRGGEILKSIMMKIPGTSDVKLSSTLGAPETKIEIDRQKMAALGLSIGEVGGALRIAFNGNDNTKFRLGTNDYNIRIALDEFDRSRTESVENLTFVNSKGKQVQLKQFAKIVYTSGPNKLERTDRNYSVKVSSQAVGIPAGTIASNFDNAMKNVTLPLGVKYSYYGMLKSQGESFQSLGLAAIAAILFIYLIMVALYNDYLHPFVVMFALPVALVGALLGLGLSNNPLSIPTILGLIMLTGLVAKNAILLVDRTNQMRDEGLKTFDALMEAGKTRLRPILMTTFSMIFGMLPIALAKGSSAEMKSGIAWVIIGGLTSSMLLTLVLVPVIYLKVQNWQTKGAALIKKIFKLEKDEDDNEIEPVVEKVS
jgi:hydrophobic/amphiphilic exporter-1 (mainly G- bacteria), HAE1 family